MFDDAIISDIYVSMLSWSARAQALFQVFEVELP